MKIQSRSSSRSIVKPIVVALGIVAVIALGWLYYAHHYQKWPFLPQAAVEKPANTVDYNKPSSDQTKAGTTIKQQVADAAKDTTTSSSDSSTSSPAASQVAMDITSVNKTSDTLMVRTLIQTVTNTGSCTLTMSGPSNGSYSASAGTQAMASTSTCKGFNVPLAGLAHGTWKVTIDFKDGATTASASKEVTL